MNNANNIQSNTHIITIIVVTQ